MIWEDVLATDIYPLEEKKKRMKRSGRRESSSHVDS